MNNHYIVKEVSRNTSDVLDSIFSHYHIEKIFDCNMWIAGGFARIIGKVEEENLNPGKTFWNYFYKHWGDIDIFSNSEDNVVNYLDKRKDKYDHLSRSPFAVNCNCKQAEFVKVQFVVEFYYKSYEDCLNNFDFTNCKYILFKKNNKYQLMKDSRSEGFNKNRLINIDKCISPLLPQRIVKYIKSRGFKSLSNTQETNESIRDYLYKISANVWDDKFNNLGNLNNIAEVYVKHLHKKIKLTDEQLSILVGSFSKNIYNKVISGYGFYLEQAGQTDWASDEIRKNKL